MKQREQRPALSQPELLPLPDSVASDRVVVRRYRAGDGAAFFAALSSHRDELMQWLAWPQQHQRMEDSESFALRKRSEFALRTSMPMGIWSTGGEFLGGSGFHEPDWEAPKAEIGYFLLPTARGQGLATEVVRLLVHYAFEQMQLNRVGSTCDANNRSSANVLRRAGLIEEGTMRAERRDHHQRLRDTSIFGLTLNDFTDWTEKHGVHNIKYR